MEFFFVKMMNDVKWDDFFENGKPNDTNDRWGNMGEAVVRHEPGKYSQVTK